MKTIICSLLCFCPLLATAEPTAITIPGEGWTMMIDLPPMTTSNSTMKGRRFRYLANSEPEIGVTISVYTELEGAANNKACRNEFWPRGLDNPNLVKGSERLFGNDTALFAIHRSEGVFRGKPFKTANVHAYIAKNGLCTDVHVSHFHFSDRSEEMLEKIVRSIFVIN